MRSIRKKSIKTSPLLLGAFCSAFLALAGCSGGSSTSSSESGCPQNQASQTEDYTPSSVMDQILEFLGLDPNTTDNNIEVTSQTRSSINFSLDGKDYAIKVQETGDSLKVGFRSAGAACDMVHQIPNLGQCQQERTPFPTILGDQTEFKECLKKMFPSPEEGSGNQKPGYDGEFN